MAGRRLLALLVALAVAAPCLGEQFVVRLGVAGVVAADLAAVVYENGVPTSDAPTLTEQPNGVDYLLGGLPDVEAGSGERYEMVFEHAGAVYHYRWPLATLTPQSVSVPIAYEVPKMPVLAQGDTLPVVEASVTGLSANPTGAEVVFELRDAADEVVLSASGAVVDVDQTPEGAWTLTVRYAWAPGDTDELAGAYFGRFRVSFPGGILSVPPWPRQLSVTVFR